MAFGFLKSIVNTAGHGISSAAGVVSKGAKSVGNLAGKVPVIGPGLHAVVNLAGSPLHLTAAIAKGDRVDKAVVGNLKGQLADVKAVAPYAQTVVSLVPGVGTGVSGIMSAGIALANGQPIDKIALAAVKGAIPGGAAGKAAFDVAHGTLTGASLNNILTAGIPLSDSQKKALQTVVGSAKAAASGQRFDAALVRAAQAQLPPDIKKAVDVGLAVAHGQNIQKLAIKSIGPNQLNALAGKAAGILKNSPIAAAGLKSLQGNVAAMAGYKVALTVSKTTPKPIELVAIREQMNPDQKKGFDLAMAAHIGLVTSKPPTKAVAKSPAAEFAYAATLGVQTMSKPAQTALLTTLAAAPETKAGVVAAVQEQKIAPKVVKLWEKILHALGLHKE